MQAKQNAIHRCFGPCMRTDQAKKAGWSMWDEEAREGINGSGEEPLAGPARNLKTLMGPTKNMH